MRTLLTASLLVAFLALGGSRFSFISTASADSTGMASMHSLVRHGNRLCMVGHFHYGADSSRRSRARALANAKRKWADFVILEYGSDWGRFSNSANKGQKCTGNKSTGFHCSVSSSPCKRLRAAPAKSRRYVKKQKKRYRKRRR